MRSLRQDNHSRYRLHCRVCPGLIAFVVLAHLMGGAGLGADADSALEVEADFPTIRSPIRIVESDSANFGTYFKLAETTYATLRGRHTVRLTEFPIADDRHIDLRLEQFSVLTSNARICEGTAHGDAPIEDLEVALFNGTVVGRPDSWVFLGVSPGFTNGVIHIGQEEEYIVAPVREGRLGGGNTKHIVYERFATRAFAPPSKFDCGTRAAADEPAMHRPTRAPQQDERSPRSSHVQRVVFIAVDGDYEYGQSFSSTSRALEYTLHLFGAISVIYERELNVKIGIPWARVWSTNSDPYTVTEGGSCSFCLGDAWEEFRAFWESNMDGVDRDLGHLLSGKAFASAGLAEIDALCSNSRGFAISSDMNGSFPTPPTDGDPDNDDLIIVAHEIGHNFGSHHTHCYEPPIDQCYGCEDCSDEGFSIAFGWSCDCANLGTGFCSACSGSCYHGPHVHTQGTLMSYCQRRTGGFANIDLEFHRRVKARIAESVADSCLREARDPCYVDWRNSDDEDGSSAEPFNTVLEGTLVVTPGGTVLIGSGSYDESLTIVQPMTLKSWRNDVTIGE